MNVRDPEKQENYGNNNNSNFSSTWHRCQYCHVWTTCVTIDNKGRR